MSKVKTTAKALRNAYSPLYSFRCGYCDLQGLNPFISARYYTLGVYGWNFDGYVFGNNLVTTGYRNMFGTRITSEDLKRINDYGKDLREKQYNNELTYDECCLKAEAFMCELLAEYRN